MKISELTEDLFSDLRRARRKQRQQKADVYLVRLNKDGSESRMNDAKTYFDEVDDAEKHHQRLVDLNKGKDIKHRIYVKGLGDRWITALLDNGVMKREGK